MKKITFWVSILWVVTLPAQADSLPLGKVTYHQYTTATAEEQNNGTSILLFNMDASVYIQESAPKKSINVTGSNGLNRYLKGDPEGFPIYKNHREKVILYKVPSVLSSKKPCVVRDTLGAIRWMISSERKSFGPYECRKATGFFRGRQYEAWFSLDIPISTGPFKLGGLPGLILEAYSLDQAVEFRFAGLEFGPDIEGAIRPPSGPRVNMGYEDFKRAEIEFCRNKEKEFLARGMEVTITPDPNAIELKEK